MGGTKEARPTHKKNKVFKSRVMGGGMMFNANEKNAGGVKWRFWGCRDKVSFRNPGEPAGVTMWELPTKVAKEMYSIRYFSGPYG